MPKKIEKLTEAQKARFGEWVEKWTKIGLSTERAEFDRAEQAVLKCYDLIERPRPEKIIRAGSPYSATLEGIRYVVNKEKEKIMADNPRMSEKDAKEKAIEEVQVSNLKYCYHGGQLWSGWYSYISFLRDVCDWEDETLENFALDEELGLTCGWVWWHDVCAAISDRPKAIHLNQANRLHFEDGYALEYPDGWGLCCWHGYTLPKSHEWLILEKNKITPETVENESNAELRRITLEIYGFERYLAERDAKVLSEDTEHGQPRRLLEVQVAGEPVRILEVVNSSLEPDGSRRKFFLGAMPGDTPHEAVAASFGRPTEKYKEAAAS